MRQCVSPYAAFGNPQAARRWAWLNPAKVLLFTGFLFVPNHKRRRAHRFPVNQKLIRRDHYDLSELGLRYSYFGRLSGATEQRLSY